MSYYLCSSALIVIYSSSIINDGLDFAETKIIADRAYKMFFEGDFSSGDEDNIDANDVIDVEVTESFIDD